jgi:hypothetical protein
MPTNVVRRQKVILEVAVLSATHHPDVAGA